MTKCRKTLFCWLICCYLAAATRGAPVDWADDAELAAHEQSGGYFEGDMDIEWTRNGLIAESKRWPQKVVYYKIDAAFDADHVAHIKRGIQMLESVSCVRFAPAPAGATVYVNVQGEPTGCHSHVGYLGKVQNVNLQIDPLDKGCFRLGTIVHEFLHTLGFHHQQSTSNRDEFVRIVEANIQDGKENNFRKYDSNVVTDFNVPYDFGSVLHYSALAFSKNGEATIVPLKYTGEQLGQRVRLSAADIDKLNIMYKCQLGI